MKKVSPAIIDACIKELGIKPEDFLSYLLVAKKLYISHGMQMTKKEYIDLVAHENKALAVTLWLLNELHCKKAEDVSELIRDMSRFEDYYMCSVDASNNIDVWPIDAILENTVHQKNIFMSKTLRVPWLHITSNTHRYWRSIDDDMDSMLNG